MVRVRLRDDEARPVTSHGRVSFTPRNRPTKWILAPIAITYIRQQIRVLQRATLAITVQQAIEPQPQRYFRRFHQARIDPRQPFPQTRQGSTMQASSHPTAALPLSSRVRSCVCISPNSLVASSPASLNRLTQADRGFLLLRLVAKYLIGMILLQVWQHQCHHRFPHVTPLTETGCDQ